MSVVGRSKQDQTWVNNSTLRLCGTSESSRAQRIGICNRCKLYKSRPNSERHSILQDVELEGFQPTLAQFILAIEGLVLFGLANARASRLFRKVETEKLREIYPCQRMLQAVMSHSGQVDSWKKILMLQSVFNFPRDFQFKPTSQLPNSTSSGGILSSCASLGIHHIRDLLNNQLDYSIAFVGEGFSRSLL